MRKGLNRKSCVRVGALRVLNAWLSGLQVNLEN